MELDLDSKVFDFLNAIIIITRDARTDEDKAIHTLAIEASNWLVNNLVEKEG